MADSAQHNGIAISPAPQVTAEVEYFSAKTVSFNITNLLPNILLVEAVTLQFQADTGSAPIYVDHPCGLELRGAELALITISVTPTCRYLEGTNVFEIMAHYRVLQGGQPGARISERHNGSYLIVRRPRDVYGDVFISFKQPEYITLARHLERYARRAGLNPYLIVDDKQPGDRQWERIDEAIRKSHFAFIIWGERTDWGTGVQKEIELCRRHQVKEVLLLEQPVGLPELFQKTAAEVEYSRFSQDDPADSFSSAISTARLKILEGRKA